MDERLKQILETLPKKSPRSRIEPYREFIYELRRTGRTYREIAAILAEKCELRVTASAVHDFVRRRSRLKPARHLERPESKLPPAKRFAEICDTSNDTRARMNAVQQRIAALKQRVPETQPSPLGFAFDSAEPLRLKQPDGKERDTD